MIDVEREHVRRVVESCGWRVRGVGGAADRLGLHPSTLETRMIKLGLKRPSR
jgi:formate hydrogenlyase transcriptional activator